jgi:DNA-binding winged helix-turn-helix (wHTH) protein/Tfp pilus assembly protein PilF
VARYRFGVFEADEASGELTRSGRRVHLPPQPFRALATLLRRAGQVVTHEELRQALWGESTFVEFEQGIRFTVSRVRAALGDDARSARYLETLPGRGYRFVAPVERFAQQAAAVAAPAPSAAPEPPPAAAPTRAWPRVIARAAAVLLLVTAGAPRPVVPYQPPPPARAAFTRGQELAGSGQRRQSLEEFRRAARLDPGYAEAHFAIASIYVDLAEGGELAPSEAFPIARAEAQRALALEDAADTHMVLASERFLFAWDWKGARREYQRAMALAPESMVPFMAYARLLSAAGEDAAAVAAIDRAEALSPSCVLALHESGWVRYRARRYAEAVRKFERAADLGPPHFMGADDWRKENRFRILLIHLQTGDAAAAGSDVDEIVRLSGASEAARARLRALPPLEAVRLVLSNSVVFITRASERQYIPPVRFAELHAALGQDEEALRWLSLAARERAPTFAYSLRDPVFDRLRGRPDFRALLAGLPIGAIS